MPPQFDEFFLTLFLFESNTVNFRSVEIVKKLQPQRTRTTVLEQDKSWIVPHGPSMLFLMTRQCCSSSSLENKTKIYNTHFISSLKNFKSGPPITQFRIEIWKIKNNVSLTTMYIMIELDVLGGISDIDIIRYRI